jgi:nuclear transport factor 2 (NTF2) superfamily protein
VVDVGDRLAYASDGGCGGRAGIAGDQRGEAAQRALGLRQSGLMSRREASINDVPIREKDRRIFGPRTETKRHGLPLR